MLSLSADCGIIRGPSSLKWTSNTSLVTANLFVFLSHRPLQSAAYHNYYPTKKRPENAVFAPLLRQGSRFFEKEGKKPQIPCKTGDLQGGGRGRTLHFLFFPFGIYLFGFIPFFGKKTAAQSNGSASPRMCFWLFVIFLYFAMRAPCGGGHFAASLPHQL